jgi:uncharacterized membrane protein
MTRQDFLARLRKGLSGLPAATIDDIVADYDAHFTDAATAGREETEVAASLGDPGRLARELRAEAGLKAWQEARSPSTAAGAILAVVGLGAIDILFLLPILIGVAGALLGLFIATVFCLIVGAAMFVHAPFHHWGAVIAHRMLIGLGLVSGAVAAGSVLTLIAIGLINGLTWYGRLHYRLLEAGDRDPKEEAKS